MDKPDTTEETVIMEWYPSETRSRHILDLYNILASLEMCENLQSPSDVHNVKSTCFNVLQKYVDEIAEEAFGEYTP